MNVRKRRSIRFVVDVYGISKMPPDAVEAAVEEAIRNTFREATVYRADNAPQVPATAATVQRLVLQALANSTAMSEEQLVAYMVANNLKGALYTHVQAALKALQNRNKVLRLLGGRYALSRPLR